MVFKKSPNFEKPIDTNKDNVYMVTIVATDKKKLTAIRDVVITVTNADDPGKITFSLGAAQGPALTSPPPWPTRTAAWMTRRCGSGEGLPGPRSPLDCPAGTNFADANPRSH